MEKDRSQQSTRRVVTEGMYLRKSRNEATHPRLNGALGQTTEKVTSDGKLLGAGSICSIM